VSSIDLDRLTRFGADVLTALGVPPSDATLVSDSLVTADMCGHPSHGMLRLPWAAARLRSGAMCAVTDPRVVSDVEIEANAERAAVDAGVVSLPGKTVADLHDLAATLGVDFDRMIAGDLV
jgi:LDH2 family malate/lactate/ureidoglycolate dehydrogenase